VACKNGETYFDCPVRDLNYGPWPVTTFKYKWFMIFRGSLLLDKEQSNIQHYENNRRLNDSRSREVVTQSTALHGTHCPQANQGDRGWWGEADFALRILMPNHYRRHGNV
jgi:hypothetical protein